MEKKPLPVSHQAFEVAAAQMSGLVNLVFFCQTVFFFFHLFIDKSTVITEPTVATAQLLGLASSLHPFSQTQGYQIGDQKRLLKCRNKAFFHDALQTYGQD